MVLPLDDLYGSHAGYVRSTLGRYGVPTSDIDDVCQDVFLVAQRRLPDFRGDSSVETWLHSICRFTAMGNGRRGRAHTALPDHRIDADGEPAIAEATYDRSAVPLERFSAALTRLRPADQDVLALHVVGGLSITELAELTGSSRPAIRAHIHEASRRLAAVDAEALPAEEATPDAPPTNWLLPHCQLPDPQSLLTRVRDMQRELDGAARKR